MALEFSSLPGEIVDRVARFLGGRDILNLRLTCKAVCRQSTPAFATAFFSTVKIDLCPEPLERLGRISRDDVLRRYVRRLVICGLPSGCPNPPRHPPGTGYQWNRHPETNHLLPAANPVIARLHDMVARLVNLRSFAIDPDVAEEPEPQPGSTGLCLGDVVYVGLLAVADAPITSLHLLPGTLLRMWMHRLMPGNVVESLTPSLLTNLVDLQLTWYPVMGAAVPSPMAGMVGMVLGATSLRKLSVRNAPAEFYDRVAAVRVAPPLEILDVRMVVRVSPGQVRALVLRFGATLRHLVIERAALLPSDLDWPSVLAEWVAALGRLESFALDHLWGDLRDVQIYFDRIFEWEGGDVSGGQIQYTTARRRGMWAIMGLRYSGSCRDTKKVFAKAVEMIYTGPPDMGKSERPPEHSVAGGIPATRVGVFLSPKLSM